MDRVAIVLAFGIAAAVSLGFWWYLGRPVELVAVPEGRLECVSYTPYDGDQNPLDPDYVVSERHIRQDLEALRSFTGCIRTYSATGPQGRVVAVAAELGLEVLAGIWINAHAAYTAKEIAAAIEIARAHPRTVRALVVGNEVLLRREMTGEQLAAIIRSVREQASVPVTYADIYEFWRRNPALADVVDFVTVHVLPYWDDPEPVSIDQVQAHVRAIIERTGLTFPGKTLMVGEIGWPSAGRTRGGAVPSRINQARFVREFAAQARTLGVAYNIIEGLDQAWKRAPEGTVGGYWGVLDGKRELKFPFAGPLSEWPRWPLAFAVATAVAAGIMLVPLLARRRLGTARWLVLAAAGQVLGSVLVIQADFVATVSRTWVDGLTGLLAIGVSAAAAAAVLPIMLGTGGPWARARPASLAEVTAWLRARPATLVRPEFALGALQGAILVAAAVTSVALAFDPRHRDVPLALFAVPTAALLVRWRVGPPAPAADRRMEAVLAAILMAAGAFSLDGAHNLEAMAWAVLSCLMALPSLSALGAETSRLTGLVAGRGQGHQAHH